MGQGMPNGMNQDNLNPDGTGGANNKKDGDGEKKKKKRFEPRPPNTTTRQGRRRRKRGGPQGLSKTPTIVPRSKCKLRLLKLDRVKG